jgi:hypothetical protein
MLLTLNAPTPYPPLAASSRTCLIDTNAIFAPMKKKILHYLAGTPPCFTGGFSAFLQKDIRFTQLIHNLS